MKKQKIFYSKCSPQLIKEWLITNYIPTAKHTFLSTVDLYAEYDHFIQNEKNNEKIWIKFRHAYSSSTQDFYLFWSRIKTIIKDLSWPVEEGTLAYEADEDDNKTMHGFYYFLKMKDKEEKIKEINKSRRIRNDERGCCDLLYFSDFWAQEETLRFSKFDINYSSTHITAIDEDYMLDFPYNMWEESYESLKIKAKKARIELKKFNRQE